MFDNRLTRCTLDDRLVLAPTCGAPPLQCHPAVWTRSSAQAPAKRFAYKRVLSVRFRRLRSTVNACNGVCHWGEAHALSRSSLPCRTAGLASPVRVVTAWQVESLRRLGLRSSDPKGAGQGHIYRMCCGLKRALGSSILALDNPPPRDAQCRAGPATMRRWRPMKLGRIHLRVGSRPQFPNCTVPLLDRGRLSRKSLGRGW